MSAAQLKKDKSTIINYLIDMEKRYNADTRKESISKIKYINPNTRRAKKLTKSTSQKDKALVFDEMMKAGKLKTQTDSQIEYLYRLVEKSKTKESEDDETVLELWSDPDTLMDLIGNFEPTRKQTTVEERHREAKQSEADINRLLGDLEFEEPEAKRPETKQPETKRPETKQPEAKQPEAKQPEPETKRPETKQPETKQPESKQPDKPRLDEGKELHFVSPDGVRYNYVGPGTNIINRVRGVEPNRAPGIGRIDSENMSIPIDALDYFAFLHDLEYSITDNRQFRSEADARMVRRIKNLKNDKPGPRMQQARRIAILESTQKGLKLSPALTLGKKTKGYPTEREIAKLNKTIKDGKRYLQSQGFEFSEDKWTRISVLKDHPEIVEQTTKNFINDLIEISELSESDKNILVKEYGQPAPSGPSGPSSGPSGPSVSSGTLAPPAIESKDDDDVDAPLQTDYTDIELPKNPGHLATAKPPNTDDINDANDDVTPEDQEAIINDKFTMANVQEYQQRSDHMYIMQQSEQKYMLESSPVLINDLPFSTDIYNTDWHDQVSIAEVENEINKRIRQSEYISILNNSTDEEATTILDEIGIDVTTFNRDVGGSRPHSIFVSGKEETAYQTNNKLANYKLNRKYNEHMNQLRAPHIRPRVKIY